MSRRSSKGSGNIFLIVFLVIIIAIGITYFYFNWLIKNSTLTITSKFALIFSYFVNILIAASWHITNYQTSLPEGIFSYIVVLSIGTIIAVIPNLAFLLSAYTIEFFLRNNYDIV